MNNITYVAFLRGINVGSNHKVNMGVLKETLEAMGYTNVITVLNSGNVLFDAPADSEKELVALLEQKLQEVFGFAIPTMIRTLSQVDAIAALKPFVDVQVAVGTRLYVTFLPEKHASSLQIPHASMERDFEIIRLTDREVFSVLTLSHHNRSVDGMRLLEDEFGKKVTTRNWNTIHRIRKAGAK